MTIKYGSDLMHASPQEIADLISKGRKTLGLPMNTYEILKLPINSSIFVKLTEQDKQGNIEKYGSVEAAKNHVIPESRNLYKKMWEGAEPVYVSALFNQDSYAYFLNIYYKKVVHNKSVGPGIWIREFKDEGYPFMFMPLSCLEIREVE